VRKFILLVLLLIPCFNLFAENEKPNAWEPSGTRFILGAGLTWTNNPELRGGHFEFGVVLYKKFYMYKITLCYAVAVLTLMEATTLY
jgi:hypothetical protein